MKRLLFYLKKYKGRLLLTLIFNVLTALFTIVTIPFVIPFFQILFNVDISSYSIGLQQGDLASVMNYYFSRLIAISDKSTALAFVCCILVLVVLLRNIFRYLAIFFHTPIRNGIIRDLRGELIDCYLNLPLRERRKTTVGELISISSNDIVEVEWSVIRMMELLIKSPLLIIGSILIMLFISAKLTIISIGLLLVVGFVMGYLSRNLKTKSQKTQELLAVLNEKVEEIGSSIKMIKAYGAEVFFGNRFKAINEDYYKKSNRILWRRDMSSPLTEFLGVGVVVILIWCGAQMVINDEMRAETFFAFIFAFYNVIEPLKSLSSAYYHVQKGIAALDRIEGFLIKKNLNTLTSGTKDLPVDWRTISFENVDYSYGELEVLQDVSFHIQKGKSIALVGRSGAGKSTLLDLLMRFDDPSSGKVTINGEDVKSISTSQYRGLFGYISQEPILFEGSLPDNIALVENVNEEEYLSALDKSRSAEFVKEKGVSNALREKGSNYSLGQRQRIALARALYHNRDILILDEGTTALDAESEHAVLQSIKDVSQFKTLLIISHKFQLVKNVDMIYVIDHGRIVNSGTHESLISSDGIYKELLSYQ